MLSDVVLVSPSVTAYALCCVFVAAVARGFSGFGFTLLAIMSLSFVLPLATIVPAMFVLEIAAGLRLLPSLWGQVHWRSIRVLVISSIMATPVGAYLLVNIPAEYVKFVLAILIIACCLVMITGYKLQKMPTAMQTAATGAGAGVLNGSLGLGGPPVIVFFPWLSAGLGSGAGVDRCSFFGNGCGCAPRFLGAWPVRTRVATSWRDELASAGVRRLVGRADCPACRGSGSAKGHSRAADAACLG